MHKTTIENTEDIAEENGIDTSLGLSESRLQGKTNCKRRRCDHPDGSVGPDDALASHLGDHQTRSKSP